MGKGDGLYNLIAFSVADPQPGKIERGRKGIGGGTGGQFNYPKLFPS